MAEATTKKRISGPERAAILMMSLGEDLAADVLRHLGAKEVQRVGELMASTSLVSKEEAEEVLSYFADTVGNQTALAGSEDYLRRVLINALGEDKALSVIDRIMFGSTSKGMEALKWMEPRSVAEIVRMEHPQIIAIVLAYLDSDQAAQVLAALPDNLRSDILMRIATLDGIQPGALQELDDILDKQFYASGNLKSSSVGGCKTAANILNFMESSLEGMILDRIKDSDPELGQKIQDLMFVFDNLAEIDDRSIQALLRETPSDTLITALKGADQRVQERLFKNMSKRASEMLREDLEARGPVRISEVETAQKEILAIARRMAEAGDVSLGGKGDEYV